MLLSIIFYGGNISISSPSIGCVHIMSCVEDLFQCFFTKTSVAPPSLPPNSTFQIFSYAQLDEATDHFNFRRSLGMGGFGTVYIGKLADGRKVAVKRYHEHKSKAIQQFKKEIEILSILQHHPNLVSLYGFSFNHSHELLLVFKFVPNGALNHHLLPYVTPSDHHLLNSVLPFLRKQLSWPTRLNIAIETASALSYLHRCGIIHRDVKSRNILLDEDLSVKVADFGLSMFLPVDESECVTDNIVSTSVLGTPGYIDPEYLVSGKVSDKSDVYSFGVVLLELISSKPAVWKGENSELITLADFAVAKILNQQLEEIVDPRLGFCSDEKVRDTITAVAELAFQCVQCSRELRPSSKQVLEILRGIEQGIWRFYQVT